jgi:predicted PurR-regulated permease PerM
MSEIVGGQGWLGLSEGQLPALPKVNIPMQRPSLLKPLLILASAVVVLAAMHQAASTVAPIMFALFITTLLTPIYRWLKRHMSGGLALLLSIGVLALVALFLLLLVGNSLTVLVSSMSSYQQIFDQRQAELIDSAGDIGQISAFNGLISVLDPARLVEVMAFVLGAAAGLFKNSLLVLFVTMFALGEGQQFISRMIKAYGADHFLPRTTTALLAMTISYFGLRAIVNLVVAVCTAMMLWLFEIPYAGLWGVLIFFLVLSHILALFYPRSPRCCLLTHKAAWDWLLSSFYL